ncbi:DUF1343 domain-containing protein [Candidatus Poribacteria bacterium]|nr:DUF1343 domain-containing protein [Candidatus Poribacteria bacterium]
MKETQRVEVGLSVLLREQLHLIEGRSVGLITNHTGVDEQLRSNIALLAVQPQCRLAALFSPEHGLWGGDPAGIKIPSAMDAQRQIPIHSLYGDTRQPTEEMLTGIEVLVYDIQDIGTRFYTFISTLLLAMGAATESDVDFVVLERPNPITGTLIEGNLLDAEFRSFVGQHPLPIRHGMTVGELAQLFKAELDLSLRLSVVPMRGWSRSMWYDQTGLPWVPPSPNMPTLETATLYPGTCLIEGTNLSEGRGTTKPFEWIGSPWMDSDKWAETLNDLDLPGVRFRPVHFKPAFSKYANEQCHGVQIHVMERDTAKPTEIVLHLISTALRDYPEQFEFRQSSGRYFFDLLAGTDSLRDR